MDIIPPKILTIGEDGSDKIYESRSLLAMNLERPLLIPGVITGMDKIMLVADPKIGKSILAQQLASALGANKPFLGYQPVEGTHRVLYIAAEGDVDEVQARGQMMGKVINVPDNRVYYWPVPSRPLNTQEGYEILMEVGREILPALTIFDPLYALMSGSMKDDEQMSALMRVINRYQLEIGSAVLLVHHNHRPSKGEDGKWIDEGDESYFGSFVVKAWPRVLWVMVADNKNDARYVALSNPIQRNRTSKLGTPKAKKLMLVEPDPLIFVDRVDGMASSQHAIRAILTLDACATQNELAIRLDRSTAMISEALTWLVTNGYVGKTDDWPVKYYLEEYVESGTSAA